MARTAYKKPPHPYKGGISDDPEILLTLPYIPHWLLRFIPEEDRQPPSPTQKGQIRRILRMRETQTFNRCMGQNKRAVMRFEKQGDFTHSGWLPGTHGYQPAKKGPGFHKHKKKPECGFCDKCRCTNKAGWGTRGDFYGLGPETGTYGVGFCCHCIEGHKILPKLVLLNARRDAEAMQRYGDIAMDTDYALKEIRAEAALAEQKQKVLDEVRAIAGELERVLAEVKSEEAFEYVQGIKSPMSTDKRARLIADLAKSRMFMRVQEATKLNREDWLQVTHVMQAAKELELAGRDMQDNTARLCRADERVQILRSLTEAEDPVTLARSMLAEAERERGETERPPEEYAWDVYVKRYVKIWQEAKAKAGQTSRQT